MFVKHAIHSEITVALSVGEDEMMTFRGLKLLFIAGLIIALPLCGCAGDDSAKKEGESVKKELKQDVDQAKKDMAADVNEAKKAGEADIEDKPQ